MLNKLIGFAPDLDPTTPGILLDCSMMVPGTKGMRAAAGPVNAGLPALAAPAVGAALLTRLDNAKRFFVGTSTKLYERNGAVWTDVSRAAPYTAITDGHWRFAQFGNASLATNGADPIQSSISGAFADISGAPRALIIETVQGFVFAFNTTDATFGSRPDAWWCSGIYDHTVWTPSIAAQCATGRLLDSPGEIRAARNLGADMIAYKERSMYVGRYQGPPVVWAWELIPGEIGATNQECVVSIGTAHVFIGWDNFYIFDGTRPQAIGDSVKTWFFRDLNATFRYRILGQHDPVNGLVYWYYPSNASTNGQIDSCIVYSYRRNQWGRANRNVQAAVEYASAQITYDTLGTLYNTYDNLPQIPYDSPFWLAASPVPAVIDSTNTVVQMTGAGVPSSLTTGDFGDDWQYSTLSGIRLRCSQDPQTGACNTFHHSTVGSALEAGLSSTLEDGKFDVLWSDRYHRAKVDFTGDVEVIGYDPILIKDGTR
ncbi:conserved hypothetical protein [Cupriavidus taiwanensis]|uniref:hypothetical protein n=1 Tax=Cupriavidus taiwanensis TaxID=164546 RepID=UPI000E116DF6|nr:hypothetical protein [Cupriavidus taiwanensis]SOY79930.1 conserved hypothetical protein [Cupriavidus taiwanensis]SOY81899.1 conserved hypothetical protein [Cupriavidus taiwanensis]